MDRPYIQIVAGSPDRLIFSGIQYGWLHTSDLALVGYAPTMPELREVLTTTTYDVVLVDAPALGGVTVLRECITLAPQRVIMCGALLAYTAALMDVRAPGYITTDDSLDDLAQVIRAVARGEQARSPLADACWQWYRAHGDTRTPVQSAILSRRKEFARSA